MEDKKIVPQPIKTQTVATEKPSPLKVDEKDKLLQKEEVKADDYNVEIVRDFYGVVDPFYLSQKDPNYHYRFLRDDMQSGAKNISLKTGNLLFQRGGWQLCPKQHLLKLGINERELSPDGFLRRGDTILAFMPEKLFQEKEEFKKKELREREKSLKKRMKGDSTSEGVRPHPTIRGLETKEKLNM